MVSTRSGFGHMRGAAPQQHTGVSTGLSHGRQEILMEMQGVNGSRPPADCSGHLPETKSAQHLCQEVRCLLGGCGGGILTLLSQHCTSLTEGYHVGLDEA